MKEIGTEIKEKNLFLGAIQNLRVLLQKLIGNSDKNQNSFGQLYENENFPNPVFGMDPKTLEIIYANKKAAKFFRQEIVGKRCCKIVHGQNETPPDCPACREKFSGSRQIITEIRGRICEITAYIEKWKNGKKMLVHVVNDQSEIVNLLNKANELEKERLFHDTINELSLALMQAKCLNEVSEIIHERAKEMTNSPHCFVGYIDPKTENLICPTIDMDVKDDCDLPKKEFGHKELKNLRESVLKKGEVLMINRSDEQINIPLGHVRIENFLGVPAKTEGKVFGVIGVANAEKDYKKEDAKLLESLSSLFALLVSNKQAQENLEESVKRFLDIAESSGEIIWEMDSDGKYTYVSGKAEEVLGFKEKEIIGKTPFDLMNPRPDEAQQEKFLCAMKKGKRLKDIENIGFGKEGDKTLLTNAVPILGEDGELIGYRGSNKDITEKRALQSQLLQLEKMESLGTMVGGVAHNLNNILAIILGNAELLQSRLPNSGSLSEIIKACIRIKKINYQLLTFGQSRFSQEKRSDLEINETLYKALLVAKAFLPSGIKISSSFSKELTINANESEIKDIIVNLTSNAIDAIPEPEKGEIKVSLRKVSIDNSRKKSVSSLKLGEYARLSFSDNGTGIEHKNLKNIFDPFFTTKEVGKGTGMGLSVVFGIVKRYGGDIQVSSNPEEGTRFDIYLPLIEGAKKEEEIHL